MICDKYPDVAQKYKIADILGDFRTMSIANLELLYKECIKQGMMPTNRSRLESMNTNDFVKELFEKFNLSKANIKEKDMTKWMNTFVGADFKKKK